MVKLDVDQAVIVSVASLIFSNPKVTLAVVGVVGVCYIYKCHSDTKKAKYNAHKGSFA